MVNIAYVRRISYLYLITPVLMFFVGWLNTLAVLVLTLFCLGSIINILRLNTVFYFSFEKKDVIFSSLLILIWVLLSGVGGFTFQNWDHHSRNALFHDLINYSWPVVYNGTILDTVQVYVPHKFILSYYFGFWLPAAFIGKLLGWNVANIFLLIWSVLGVFLFTTITAYKINLSSLKTILLIIFFSGMDILGSLLFQNLPLYTYPKLFPPIVHLEWWAGTFGFLQYSSFTTDLFWTYNQFIPVFLIMSLFVSSLDFREYVFLTGLCVFFAPLPAVGLLLYVIAYWVKKYFHRNKTTVFDFLKDILCIENISGGMIAGVSLLFFSTNFSVEEKSFGLPASLLLFLFFSLFEWLILWLFLLPANKKDERWYVTGVILLFFPFLSLGGSWDFMMRASIPSLYFLLIACGSFLSTELNIKRKLPLLIFLLIGSITPIYEINRSVFRTMYYFNLPIPSSVSQYFENPPNYGLRFVPELDHIQTLSADEWQSISIPNDEGWVTKAGGLFPDFYRFIWKDDLVN